MLGLTVPPMLLATRRRGDRVKTARVHHAARRRGGGVAARGARAAARADAAHRRAHAPLPRTIADHRPARGVPCRACSNWAGPIGRNVRIDTRWAAGDADRIRKLRGGTGRARAGRHPGHWQRDRAGRCCRRPAPCRSCSRTSPIRSAPASSTAWRGRAATSPASRLFEYGMSGEMAGAAQADRAGRDASGGPSGSRHKRRDRPVRGHPGRGAVARGGGEPGQRARRRRDRARRRGLRARAEWRPDRDGERVGERSSRSDRHAGGPAQAARGLLRTLLRHRRRPDLLWG